MYLSHDTKCEGLKRVLNLYHSSIARQKSDQIYGNPVYVMCYIILHNDIIQFKL